MKTRATIILALAVMITSCVSGRYELTDKEREHRRLLRESYYENCKIELALRNGAEDNANPAFRLTIVHAEVSSYPFEVYMDPGYPACGTLVVWRDGELISELEPIRVIEVIHVTRAYDRFTFTPGMVLSLNFDADERYVRRPQCPDAGEPDDALWDMSDTYAGYFSVTNPFNGSGRYDVQFKLLDRKKELNSNKITITNSF
jgi:hypothetical protein